MSESSPIKLISIKDFSSICRTCFGDENLLPLFELIVDNVNGTDLLEFSVNLEANRSDNLPENICEACLKELDRMYKFKRQCNENDAILKLLNSEYDREIEIDNPIKIENEEIDPLSETTDIEKCEEKVESETTPRSYQCKNCLQSFETYVECVRHKQKVHYSKPTHPCKFCNKLFTHSKMKQHMRTHTKEQPYQCNICSRRFSALSSFKRHKIVHAAERPHICSQCGKQFSRITYLHTHEKLHQWCKSNRVYASAAYNYNCEQCGKAFKTLGRFTAHIKKHAAPGNSESTMPNSTREYICEICGHASKTKAMLEVHLLTHGEKNIVCDKCGKGFCTKTGLYNHRLIHTNERPHKCTLCNKSFARSSVLDIHMSSHSGYKPFKCNQCFKTFALRQPLIRHLRMHTGERPHECKFCGKAFALNYRLKIHERIHTRVTPHVCRVCKRGFYDAGTLKRHAVKKHAAEKDRQEN